MTAADAARVPGTAYQGQLAARAAELLPGIGLEERLALLAAMDPDEMSASLAWLASLYPQVFDCSLVRDTRLVERLVERLDAAEVDEDDPQPYCSACGATVGIFIGHGDAWLHYTGEGTAASPVELYDAGHAPAVAWRGEQVPAAGNTGLSPELVAPVGVLPWVMSEDKTTWRAQLPDGRTAVIRRVLGEDGESSLLFAPAVYESALDFVAGPECYGVPEAARWVQESVQQVTR